MNLYSLYSNSQKRYNIPFVAVDDKAAIDQVSKMVAAQSDPALLSSLDDLQLEKVAGFVPDANVLHGEAPVCELTCPELIMEDLHKNLPLPPTLKARLDKFYGGVENA